MVRDGFPEQIFVELTISSGSLLIYFFLNEKGQVYVNAQVTHYSNYISYNYKFLAYLFRDLSVFEQLDISENPEVW